MTRINKYGEILEPDDGHSGSNVYKIDCQVCGTTVTVIDGRPPRVVCPYIERIGRNEMRCNKKDYETCGIFEGMKQPLTNPW